jgi:hypothetical protein
MLVTAEADSASAGVYNVRACDPAFGADVNHVFAGSNGATPPCAPGRGIQTSVSASGRASLQVCAPNGARVVAVRATASSRWQGAGYDRRIDGGDCGEQGHVAGGSLAPSPSASDTQNWMVTGLSLGGVRLTTGCAAMCSSGSAVTDWSQISFTLDDNTPPSVEGARGLWGQDGWVRGSWTTAFDAADPTGIRSLAVRIDGAEKASAPGTCQPDGSITRLNPCASTSMSLSRDVDTTTVPDGRHDLTVEARDGGRNAAAPRADVRIDNSAPVATLARSEEYYSRQVAWEVNDPHAGVDMTSLAAVYSADGGTTWQSMDGSWADGRYTATVPSEVPDGTVRVRLSGRDNAEPGGNEFATSESSIEVDATPPGAPTVAVPDRWLNRSDASHWDATLTPSSEPRSGIRGYSVTRNDSDPDAGVDVDGPTWRIDQLADGATTLKARAVSRAGVASPIAQAVIRMDRELPTAALRGAGNPAVPHPGPVTVTLSGRDRVSGVAQVAYSLDGAAWARVPGDEARIPITGDGAHRLSYYVVDEAGNASAEDSRTIVLDSGPDPFLASGDGFSATATNPRTTFTAAKRFGDPCPAEAMLTPDRAATVAEAEPHKPIAGISVGAAPRRDALIGFPLPAAPDCTVESAVLRIDGAQTIEVRRASSAWTQSAVTWATRPGTVGQGVTGQSEWDVTAQVQGLYDHGDNGLYLRAVDGPVVSSSRAELIVRFSE